MTDWYFREGGVVTQTAKGVADATRYHLANAYRKAWAGEALTPDELAAVEAAKGQPLSGSVAGNMLGDTALGFLALQAPELLREMDALAERIAERLGGLPFLAWEVAADYTARALAVTKDESGISDLLSFADDDVDEAFAAGRDLARFDLPPERLAEIVAERAASKAFEAAWDGSPEQLATLAEMAPDGGPEGWSQVPGFDQDKAFERQQAFAARYHAALKKGGK